MGKQAQDFKYAAGSPAGDWGSRVEELVGAEIDKVMAGSPELTRAQAAQAILDSKEGWYVQTPEGEYLNYVATGHIERRGREAQMSNPIIEMDGYKYEVEIMDSVHLRWKVEGSDQWGIPLHIAQVPEDAMKQLRDTGYVRTPSGGGGESFVYLEGKQAGRRVAVEVPADG